MAREPYKAEVLSRLYNSPNGFRWALRADLEPHLRTFDKIELL